MKTMMMRAVLGLGLMAAAGTAAAQAIMGTEWEGHLMVVFPTPGVGLPTPTQQFIARPSGMSSTSPTPNSVSPYGDDYALISNRSYPRIFNVRLSTLETLSVIQDASTYYGGGTLAVSPNARYALAMGGEIGGLMGPNNIRLHVLHAPFRPGLQVHALAIPGFIHGDQSGAIVFNEAGRAFVHTSAGIQILDPPYVQVKTSIPINNDNVGGVNQSGGAIAISPDGNTLLVTRLRGDVLVYRAPFLSSSLPAARIPVPGDYVRLNGIRITPDGQTALVVSQGYAIGRPVAFSIRAPFAANSQVTPLLNSDNHLGGFEDLDISPDGRLAILTGGSVNNMKRPAVFIQAPFNANATVHRVPVGINNGVNWGRGAGSVRFMRSAGTAQTLFADGFE